MEKIQRIENYRMVSKLDNGTIAYTVQDWVFTNNYCIIHERVYWHSKLLGYYMTELHEIFTLREYGLIDKCLSFISNSIF